MQARTISHTGNTLEATGEDAVWLRTNLHDPQRESEIVEFRCPSSFESISWVAARDPVRFVPRTHESISGSFSGDEVDIDAPLQPIAGEPDPEDQPHQAVIITADGSPVEVDYIDYAANQAVLQEEQTDVDLNAYPIIRDGTLKFRGRNQLGHHTEPLFPWGHPLQSFHDFRQDRRDHEINLAGSIRWDRDEVLEVLLDSPYEIVWQDSNYPGAYVSTFEMDVQIRI